MKATKILHSELETIERFLAIFGQGMVSTTQNKPVGPGFFIYSANFIHDFIEDTYFKKEEILLRFLEENGMDSDGGPIGTTLSEQTKSRDFSRIMSEASTAWRAGDETGRADTLWAASSFTGLMRQHINRTRSLLFPLAEQLIPEEEHYKIAEAFNRLAFENPEPEDVDKNNRLILMLEEEAREWK